MRGTRIIIAASIALAAAAGGTAGCYTVDLGQPPSDVNACRPSQTYYVYGTAGDGGMGNNGIWRDLLDKDYGGKKCHDSACHGSGSTNSLRLTVPSCVPPACNPPIPLTQEWADNYRSTAEQMNCANVGSSKLLEFPSAIQVHGGGKIFDRNAPNAEPDLIIGWVSAAP